MDFSMHVKAALMQLLVLHAPELIAYAIGIVVAIRRWKRHPRISMLVVAGCGLAACGRAALYFAYPMIHF